MRRFVFSAARLLGAAALFRWWHRDSLVVLLYHGVAPKENRGIYNYRGKFIAPEAFDRHIHYLSRHYRILGLDDAVARLRSRTLPPYALAITFDDGYRNNYEFAFPVLKKYRVPATMFIATDFVFKHMPLWVDRLEYAIGAQKGSYAERISRDAKIRQELKGLPDAEREARLKGIESASGVSFGDFSGERNVYAPLSEAQIRDMQAGGITFGAHTESHPILSRVNDERARQEIRGSTERLRACCGKLSDIFAYPNGNQGDWTEMTERLLAEEGFSGALTTIEGFNTGTEHPMRLKRIAMDGTGPYGFASIVSGVRIYLRTLYHG